MLEALGGVEEVEKADPRNVARDVQKLLLRDSPSVSGVKDRFRSQVEEFVPPTPHVNFRIVSQREFMKVPSLQGGILKVFMG